MVQNENIDEIPRFQTADDAQNLASHPQKSAWVSASAGTGKTKVLTDRVLRLLLPRENGQEGTPLQRLVCLTYTKAAANEMAVRITKRLGSWAVMDVDNPVRDKSLRHRLEKLLGYPPERTHIDAARRLFAEIVDSSGGLQIMTIHAFCQSVLGRFPIEAGVPPDFKVIDEGQANEFMRRAQAQMINKARESEQSGSPLSEAFYNLSIALGSESFVAQISEMSKERNQISGLLRKYHNVEGIYSGLCGFYGIVQGEKAEGLVKEFCEEGQFDREGLREAAETFIEAGGKLAPQRAVYILDWIVARQEDRVEDFSLYRKAFLTMKDTVHKKAFPPAAINKTRPHVSDILHKEAERIIELIDTIKCVHSAQMTRDIFYVAQEVLNNYEHLKQKEGCLDYADLISRTMKLLTGCTDAFENLNDDARAQVLSWVLYKLDQGIDHILIDEAQDTNPEQWKIIETLSDDFFSGEGSREDVVRTYFTVGDIKQSIYGFQRAAPDEFKRMEGVFDKKIKQAGQINNIVPLDISFRSTESILRVVDNVFTDEISCRALGETNIHHRAYREGQEGTVELWPIFESLKPEKLSPWEPMVQVQTHDFGAETMARFIAEKIKNWTSGNEIIKSRDRSLEPGDIMILVRSRTGIVEHLIRALKMRGVPVIGADRMIVSDQLAVQDLIALARFCLLPEDDLTLAEVLKSPFIGYSEDDIFALSYRRAGTLWQELCNPDWGRLEGLGEEIILPDEDKRRSVQQYLSRMAGRVRMFNSYEFFSIILSEKCPADSYSGMRAMCRRLGEEAFDPIDELLNMALDFTYDHADHIQKFLDEQDRVRKEIKREMEEAENKVRIMTIHGAKGLQAPVVILPDTMQKRKRQNRDNVLWPAKTGLGVPLYASNVNAMPEVYAFYKNERLCVEEEEQNRLLYVAMTRAADRLYVTGYTGATGSKEGGWYEKIQAAMEKDELVQHINIPEGEVLRIENPQTKKPDKVEGKRRAEIIVPEFEPWVFEKPESEPVPPKPLVPSRPSQEEEKQDRSLSPLVTAHNKRFLRGNVTHKLLEFLPDYPQEKHKEIAEGFVNKNEGELSQDVRESIVEEVCAILSHPEYKDFFRHGSMAEVPVTALMPDGKVISGQIDRLVISEKDIWIVDYKTNRPSPREKEAVPKIYRDQLKAYRDVVQKIYPKHSIHCALLWTDVPRLMRVDV
ncbi:MAG: double-strand break repair helicase AddA [Alphaproteobacteria bacterium]|nr:double-strand break repair helicase AddA [Alphaproteobacteria bacterium]